MKMRVSILTAADAAFLLRLRLGPLRSWPAFLSDCIRGRQDVAGHKLLPCCRWKHGRMFRPAYNVADIKEFIRCVLAAEPTAGKVPLKPVAGTIETSLGWRSNKIDTQGDPTSRTA
jgi:hypothetical protein